MSSSSSFRASLGDSVSPSDRFVVPYQRSSDHLQRSFATTCQHFGVVFSCHFHAMAVCS